MSTEDRITAALHALAEQGTAAADGEGRLALRLRREHRLRRGGAVLGSAAVVAGVAFLAGTLGTTGPSTSPTPAPLATADEPSPSTSPDVTYPPTAADVDGPSVLLALEADATYGFRNARTGALAVSGRPEGFDVTDVAAVGDEKTFYFASTKEQTGGCGTSLLQRLVLTRPGDDSSDTISDVPGGRPLSGEVQSIAISHDGTRLAYVIATELNADYGGCGIYEVRVDDLRTGETRSWSGGDATVSSPSWAPDDRTLLLHVQACCGDYSPGVTRLDTVGPGTSFADGPALPGTEKLADCRDGGGISVTASSRTEVFAVQECFGDEPAERVVVMDPSTGRVLRTIATIAGLDQAWSMSVTPDGRHVVLAAPNVDGPENFRIDDGIVSQLPTHLQQIAW